MNMLAFNSSLDRAARMASVTDALAVVNGSNTMFADLFFNDGEWSQMVPVDRRERLREYADFSRGALTIVRDAEAQVAA